VFCELKIYEAAVGDITLPAMSRQWRSSPKADVELDHSPVSGHSLENAAFRGRRAAL